MQQLYAHVSFMDHIHPELGFQFPTETVLFVAVVTAAYYVLRKHKKKS